MRFYIINFSIIFLTYFFAPIFYFKILIRKKKIKRLIEEGKLNILIFQTPRIGDMVCTTPVFREIKKKYPLSKIIVLGDKNTLGVLYNNPHIDQIFSYSRSSFLSFLKSWLRFRKVDSTHSLNFFPSIFPSVLPFWLNIQNRISTTTNKQGVAIKILDLFINKKLLYKKGEYAPSHHLKLLVFLGINSPNPKREIFISTESYQKVDNYLKELKIGEGRPVVGISISCDKKFREWPKRKFVEVVNLLQEKYKSFILFIGGENDKIDIEEVQAKIFDIKNSSNLGGFFSIKDLPALLKRLNVFISVDTGPLYMADAVGVPVIDIAGPSDTNTQSPQGNKYVILRGGTMENIKTCSYVMYRVDCKNKDIEKLIDVSPIDVLNAYENIVSK